MWYIGKFKVRMGWKRGDGRRKKSVKWGVDLLYLGIGMVWLFSEFDVICRLGCKMLNVFLLCWEFVSGFYV